MTAWWRSRSRRLTAGACSGMNRPQSSNGQCEPIPRASFVGASHEAEEQLGAGRVEWGESDLIDQDEVGAEDVLDDAADAVAGEPAVEGLDEFGGGEVADPFPG